MPLSGSSAHHVSDYGNCPCTGSTLEKLIHPAVLTVLAQEDLHGYKIAERIGEMPMFEGPKPDVSGVYRAIKEAVIAKEHSIEPLDTAIFFMDLRTHGKDFERYYERAKEVQGVRFIRSRVHTILAEPATRNLVLRYAEEDGVVKEEQFDLAVLSVGLTPPKEARQLAERTGIELDAHGFCRTGSLRRRSR